MLKKYFEPGALLSFPAYRALLLSGILTVIAMSAFPIALAVTVLDAGGSATTLGLILAVRVLSGVVLAPVGSVGRSIATQNYFDCCRWLPRHHGKRRCLY